MAEFATVMHEMARMCDVIIKKDECENCPISHNVLCGVLCNMEDKAIAEAEAAIMAWAAEHPEPQYPTWGEYLKSMGVIVPRKNYTVMDTYSLIISQINSTHISADIAKKLGIEPKEKNL